MLIRSIVVVSVTILGMMLAEADEPEAPIRGRIAPGIEHFDRMVQDLMDRYGVPGGALAIVKDGRLVLARGYGWADVQAREPVRPEMLFGVASVSKSFTAVTVLKMIEERRFKLDEPIMRLLPKEEPPRGHREDPRWHQITVRMLLDHSGGWNRHESGDPGSWSNKVARELHVRQPISRPELFRFMLGERIDFDPGTQCEYSNFGYMLLGLIVEHQSRERYGEYVHKHTLTPMGIHGGRLPDEEKRYVPNEVHRYVAGTWQPLPPFHVPMMDPAGGWTFSVIDLVKFLCAVDGSRGQRFLSEEMTQAMLSPPPPPVKPRANGSYFGLGWDAVRRKGDAYSYAKNGGLAGVRSFIGHNHDGVNWAIVLNGGEQHHPGELGLDSFAYRQVQKAITETKKWPTEDYFRDFR